MYNYVCVFERANLTVCIHGGINADVKISHTVYLKLSKLTVFIAELRYLYCLSFLLFFSLRITYHLVISFIVMGTVIVIFFIFKQVLRNFICAALSLTTTISL